MNVVVVIKIFLLFFIVVFGWVVLGGVVFIDKILDLYVFFEDLFVGFVLFGNLYVIVLFKVLQFFVGWQNVVYVFNEVKWLVYMICIVGFFVFFLCGIMYMFINVVYFVVVIFDEIVVCGIIVGVFFMGKVFNYVVE